MKQVVFLLFLVCWVMQASFANELYLSDTLNHRYDKLSLLLKNKDYAAKAEFLNSFYSPAYFGGLKSSSEELQLDSIVVNKWSEELQRIEKSDLYTYTFEDDGKTVLVDIKKWDSEKNSWVNGSHNYYWFDEMDRLKEVEFQEYVNAEYRFYIRIDYEYENGLLKYETQYDRIDEEEFWDEVEQVEYEYSDDNLFTAVYTNEWDTYELKWVPNAFRTFKYDSNRVLKTETGFDFNYFDDVSVKKFELRYTYDSLGFLHDVVEYIPGWEEGIFVPENRQAYTYDLYLKLESETHYSWDYDADDWMQEVKWIFQNEPNGAVLWEQNNYLWNSENLKWESSFKSACSSENRFVASDIKDWNFLEIYLPVFAFDDVVCDRMETHNIKNDTWEMIAYSDYYFSEGDLVSVNDRNETSVRVFPNPVVDVLNIELNTFDEMTCLLRNLYGQIVIQKMVQNREEISLQGLIPGVYIVEIKSAEGTVFAQKLLKN